MTIEKDIYLNLNLRHVNEESNCQCYVLHLVIRSYNSLHLRWSKVRLGHLVATLHHFVEPGVHRNARVRALTLNKRSMF